MLEVVIKFLCSMLGSITGILIIENISHKKIKLDLKNIVLLIVLSIISTIQFRSIYTITITLTVYIATIFIYDAIFKIGLRESVLACGMLLIVIITSDLFCSLFLLQFLTKSQIRDVKSWFILSNILVYTVSYIMVVTTNRKKFLTKFYQKTSDSTLYSQFIFVILAVITFCLIVYDLTSHNLDGIRQYSITLVTFVIMLVLVLIYIKSKNDNDRLQQRFNNLYDYSQDYEEWIVKEQLAMHENKNQLIVIRNMVKQNSKAVDYINEIINEDYGLEDKWLGQLINVPSGGLKGLLYYKLITIEKNKLNFCVDISQNAKSKLKKIQKEQLKDISHIIGIYLDNAIEASIKSNKKMLSLEIYCIKKKLNVVITNSFNGKIDITKLNSKGYTTKGKGRGNGLYFVTKIKEKNNNIDTKTNIINDYFVQRIVVN